MNKVELKEIVKKYFSLTEMTEITKTNSEAKVEKFAEGKLIDNTVITNMVDAEFEVGQELHVITEAGEHVLAPSGEHELQGGDVITVDGEGKITGLKRLDEVGEGSLEGDPASVSTEMSEHEDDLIVTGDEPQMMDDMDVKEAIIQAIAEVVMPEMELLKAKVVEMEEQMKKHYSATPAAVSTLESKFSKTAKKQGGFDTSKLPAYKQAMYNQLLNQ